MRPAISKRSYTDFGSIVSNFKTKLSVEELAFAERRSARLKGQMERYMELVENRLFALLPGQIDRARRMALEINPKLRGEPGILAARSAADRLNLVYMRFLLREDETLTSLYTEFLEGQLSLYAWANDLARLEEECNVNLVLGIPREQRSPGDFDYANCIEGSPSERAIFERTTSVFYYICHCLATFVDKGNMRASPKSFYDLLADLLQLANAGGEGGKVGSSKENVTLKDVKSLLGPSPIFLVFDERDYAEIHRGTSPGIPSLRDIREKFKKADEERKDADDLDGTALFAVASSAKWISSYDLFSLFNAEIWFAAFYDTGYSIFPETRGYAEAGSRSTVRKGHERTRIATRKWPKEIAEAFSILCVREDTRYLGLSQTNEVQPSPWNDDDGGGASPARFPFYSSFRSDRSNFASKEHLKYALCRRSVKCDRDVTKSDDGFYGGGVRFQKNAERISKSAKEALRTRLEETRRGEAEEEEEDEGETPPPPPPSQDYPPVSNRIEPLAQSEGIIPVGYRSTEENGKDIEKRSPEIHSEAVTEEELLVSFAEFVLGDCSTADDTDDFTPGKGAKTLENADVSGGNIGEEAKTPILSSSEETDETETTPDASEDTVSEVFSLDLVETLVEGEEEEENDTTDQWLVSLMSEGQPVSGDEYSLDLMETWSDEKWEDEEKDGESVYIGEEKKTGV